MSKSDQVTGIVTFRRTACKQEFFHSCYFSFFGILIATDPFHEVIQNFLLANKKLSNKVIIFLIQLI